MDRIMLVDSGEEYRGRLMLDSNGMAHTDTKYRLTQTCPYSLKTQLYLQLQIF